MESDIARKEILSWESPPEPHFDKEATLLSARPVVPLRKIMAEARSRRLLAFGLTVLASLIIGAVGATLIHKRGQKQTTAIDETSSPVSQQSLQRGEAMTEASGAISGSSQAAPTSTVDRADAVPAGQASNSGNSTLSQRRAHSVSQSGDSRREREMRGAQRAESRRLRRRAEREARREARGYKTQSPDDLLRIREIFEGSPP